MGPLASFGFVTIVLITGSSYIDCVSAFSKYQLCDYCFECRNQLYGLCLLASVSFDCDYCFDYYTGSSNRPYQSFSFVTIVLTTGSSYTDYVLVFKQASSL